MKIRQYENEEEKKMKKVILFLVCVSILILGLSVPAGSVPNSPKQVAMRRLIVLYLPDNCSDQVNQKVLDNHDEISIKITCEPRESHEIKRIEHDLVTVGIELQEVALTVQTPYDYDYFVDVKEKSARILLVVERSTSE